MLDIKFIRENKDLIQAGAKKKHVKFDVEELLKVDDDRKAFLSKVEEMKAEQNVVSRQIANVPTEQRDAKISQMQILKDSLQEKEKELKEIMTKWQTLMLQVPNIPDMSVPEGKSDEENVETKTWGEKPKFDFEPRDHVEIMKNLDMVDFERGSKVHGFRGYYLKNDGALLSWAIWNYAQDFFLKKEFTPMIVPAIVKKANLYGTGHLPTEAEDLYETQDGDYLSGTAEVATMGYYSDEVIDFKDGDKKFLSFSPCYRREAGSYGKDTKGLIRVHEFYKLEQVILCEADHQKSVEYHDWLNRNTEEFIESLNIPYHTVINCGGDLGLGQVKKYDIELWVPMEEKYREISSASYFHDFQTRRFGIKYKDESGKQQFAHSLNCTAIPTPRILVSLIENFQQADGSVKIPEVLQKYMGGKDLITK
ncbi:serine--tRNA ligase [Patescibacteria group bacterium]